MTICSGAQPAGGVQPNGYTGARCAGSSAWRMTSMTTPSNCSPAKPSSSNIKLKPSDRRQSPRNCQASASSRRTSSPEEYRRS